MNREELKKSILTLNDEGFAAFKDYTLTTQTSLNSSILQLLSTPLATISAAFYIDSKIIKKAALNDADLETLVEIIKQKAGNLLEGRGNDEIDWLTQEVGEAFPTPDFNGAVDLLVIYIKYAKENGISAEEIWNYVTYADFEKFIEGIPSASQQLEVQVFEEQESQSIFTETETVAPESPGEITEISNVEVFKEDPIDILPKLTDPPDQQLASKPLVDPTPSEVGGIDAGEQIDDLHLREFIIEKLDSDFALNKSIENIIEILKNLNTQPNVFINDSTKMLESFIEINGGLKQFLNFSATDLALKADELREIAKKEVPVELPVLEEKQESISIFEQEEVAKIEPATLAVQQVVEKKKAKKKKADEELTIDNAPITDELTKQLNDNGIIPWDTAAYGEPPIVNFASLKLSEKQKEPYVNVINSLPTEFGVFENADSKDSYTRRLFSASKEDGNINALNFHPIFSGMTNYQVMGIAFGQPNELGQTEVVLSSQDISTLLENFAREVDALTDENKRYLDYIIRESKSDENRALQVAQQSRLNLSRKLDNLLAAIKKRDDEVYRALDSYIRDPQYTVGTDVTRASKRACMLSAKIAADEALCDRIASLSISITRPKVLLGAYFESQREVPKIDITQEGEKYKRADLDKLIESAKYKLRVFLNNNVKEKGYWYNYSFCSYILAGISESTVILASKERQKIDAQYYVSCTVCGKNIYTSRLGKSDLYSDFDEQLYNLIVPPGPIFRNGAILNDETISKNDWITKKGGLYPAPPGYSGEKSWEEIKALLISRSKKSYIEGVKRREHVFKVLGAEPIGSPRKVSDSKFRCPFSFDEDPISGVKTEKAVSDFQCGNYFDPTEYIRSSGSVSTSSLPSRPSQDSGISTTVSFNIAINEAFENLNTPEDQREVMRKRLAEELEKRTSAGWKYSNKFFNCPCKIDAPDAASLPELIKKHPHIAIPLSGPFKKSNTPLVEDYMYVPIREGLNLPYLSPPTSPDGSFRELQDGTMAYMVCGKEANLSSFNRDPNDPKSLPNLIKSLPTDRLRLLLQELIALGVDVQDLMEYLTEIEFGARNVSAEIKNKRMVKIAELLVTASFPIRLETGITGGGGLQKIDILKDVSLVCKEGHIFTISDSVFFSRTHTEYDMSKSSKSEIDRVIASGILTSQGFDNFKNVLNFSSTTNLDIVQEILDADRAISFDEWTMRNRLRRQTEGGEIESGKATALSALKFSEGDKTYVFGNGLSRLYAFGYTGAGRGFSGGFTSGRLLESIDYSAGGGQIGVYFDRSQSSGEDGEAGPSAAERALDEVAIAQYLEQQQADQDSEFGEGLAVIEPETEIAKNILNIYKDRGDSSEGVNKATGMLGISVYKILENINNLLKISSSLDVRGMNIGQQFVLSKEKPDMAAAMNSKFISIIDMLFEDLSKPQNEMTIDSNVLSAIKQNVISNLGFIKKEDESYYAEKGLINDILNIDLRFADQYDLSLIRVDELSARTINAIAESAMKYIGSNKDLSYVLSLILQKYYGPNTGERFYRLQLSKLDQSIISKIQEFVDLIKSAVAESSMGESEKSLILKDPEKMAENVANLKAKEYLGRLTAASTAYAMADYFSIIYSKHLKPGTPSSTYVGYNIIDDDSIDLSNAESVVQFAESFDTNKDSIVLSFGAREMWQAMRDEGVDFGNYIDNEDMIDILNDEDEDGYPQSEFLQFFYGAYEGATLNNPSYIIEQVILGITNAITNSSQICMAEKYMTLAKAFIQNSLNNYLSEAATISKDKVVDRKISQVKALVDNVFSIDAPLPLTTVDITKSGKYRSAFGGTNSEEVSYPHELVPIFWARQIKSSDGSIYPIYALMGGSSEVVYHNFIGKTFDPATKPKCVRALHNRDLRIDPANINVSNELTYISESTDYPGWHIYEILLGKSFTMNITEIKSVSDQISLVYHPATKQIQDSGKTVGYTNPELGMDTTESLSISKLAPVRGRASLFPPAPILSEQAEGREDSVPTVGFPLPIEIKNFREQNWAATQRMFAPIVHAKIPVMIDGIQVDMSDFLMRDPPHIAHNILRDIEVTNDVMQRELELVLSKKEAENIRQKYKSTIVNYMKIYRDMPFYVNNKRTATFTASGTVNIATGQQIAGQFDTRTHPYIPLLDWTTINKMITSDIFGPEYGGHRAWPLGADESYKTRIKNAIQQFLIGTNNLDIMADTLSKKLGIDIDPSMMLDPVKSIFERGLISQEKSKQIFGYDVLGSTDKYGYVNPDIETAKESYEKTMGIFGAWHTAPSRFYPVGMSDRKNDMTEEPIAQLKFMNTVFNASDRRRELTDISDPSSRKILGTDHLFAYKWLVGQPTTVAQQYPVPSTPEKRTITHVALRNSLASLTEWLLQDYNRSLNWVINTPQFSLDSSGKRKRRASIDGSLNGLVKLADAEQKLLAIAGSVVILDKGLDALWKKLTDY